MTLVIQYFKILGKSGTKSDSFFFSIFRHPSLFTVSSNVVQKD